MFACALISFTLILCNVCGNPLSFLSPGENEITINTGGMRSLVS